MCDVCIANAARDVGTKQFWWWDDPPEGAPRIANNVPLSTPHRLYGVELQVLTGGGEFEPCTYRLRRCGEGLDDPWSDVRTTHDLPSVIGALGLDVRWSVLTQGPAGPLVQWVTTGEGFADVLAALDEDKAEYERDLADTLAQSREHSLFTAKTYKKTPRVPVSTLGLAVGQAVNYIAVDRRALPRKGTVREIDANGHVRVDDGTPDRSAYFPQWIAWADVVTPVSDSAT